MHAQGSRTPDETTVRVDPGSKHCEALGIPRGFRSPAGFMGRSGIRGPAERERERSRRMFPHGAGTVPCLPTRTCPQVRRGLVRRTRRPGERSPVGTRSGGRCTYGAGGEDDYQCASTSESGDKERRTVSTSAESAARNNSAPDTGWQKRKQECACHASAAHRPHETRLTSKSASNGRIGVRWHPGKHDTGGARTNRLDPRSGGTGVTLGYFLFARSR